MSTVGPRPIYLEGFRILHGTSGEFYGVTQGWVGKKELVASEIYHMECRIVDDNNEACGHKKVWGKLTSSYLKLKDALLLMINMKFVEFLHWRQSTKFMFIINNECTRTLAYWSTS